ncbi:MAG: MiaB/RimO family radical SAM methylthiotransferase [Candidatus Woykebacteria bacterium]
MAKLKYFIITFGCQQNMADSERVAGAYESRNFVKALSLEKADHIVINTCMVRQHAEDKVYGIMQKLKPLKEANPNFKLVVTGCLVGAMARDPSGKMYKIMKARLPLVDEFLPIDEVGFDVPIKREDKEHAWVVISQGCNNFCTFCIVPFTRGREISRPWADIINEVDDLKSKDYKRVTLLGQNVNSYGADFVKESLRDGFYQLPDGRAVLPVMVKMSMGRKRIPTIFPYLLEEVVKKGFEKVSFLSSNPWDFSDELVDVISRNNNIDRYIHLPVQSGDDAILRKMNRWYTSEEYKDLVRRIRAKVENVEIGTDLIVGFPGETEEQFNNTMRLAKEIGWAVAYIGMYSPRSGTASHKNFPDEVTRAEKLRRFHILDDLINKQKVGVPS